MIRLAVVGDIHAYRLWVAPWQLLGKRFLGQSNLWLRRRHQFSPAPLSMVVQRVAAIRPDLILFSGDLSTTALPGEFAQAADIFRPLLERFPCLMVAGNHDRYTYRSCRRRSLEQQFGRYIPDAFPHLKAIGPRWQLLALDSAVPRLLTSRGRLGEAQIRAAEENLRSLDCSQGLVTLCHYPIFTPVSVHPRWEHRLADAPRWVKAMETARQEGRWPGRMVYVHGHIHEPWCHQVPEGPLQGLVDLNAGSPSRLSYGYRLGQGFWELQLPDDPGQTLTCVHHRPVSHGDDGWITQAKVIGPEIPCASATAPTGSIPPSNR
ncbi:MAG: metallophosphoesterase [Phycisphaeraceae bacterium]|nr:metallophosphoesterase [Phycisphaeraceae bacterium]